MATIKNTNNNQYWPGCEKREPSYTADGNVNWYNRKGKQYGGFSKTKNRPAIGSSNSILRNMLKGM
jgi:hypothetical protein